MRPLFTALATALIAVGSIATSTLADVTLQSGGSSFAKSIMQRWSADFSTKMPGTKLEYNSQGSGFGINGVINKTLDLAGSDALMNQDERTKAGGEVLHIPSVAGAVVMAYNLPGFEGDLKLTGPIIAEIYMGKISKWNDSQLAELNPGAKLPDLAITPVYRSDASGTTFVFTNFLATQSTDFIKASPPGKSITVAGGQGGKGNEGVTSTVQKIPGGIGYIELTYALNNKVAFATMKNRAGEWVKASTDSVSAAGKAAEKLTAPIWNSKDKDAYPISAFTYILVSKDLSYMKDQAKAKAVVEFIKYAVTDGQGAAPSLYYAPLPETVREKAVEAIKGITFDGKPIAE